MTLVLPASTLCGGYQSAVSKSDFFDSKMPCGFEGEPLDFEAALLSSEFVTTDWPLKHLTWAAEANDKITPSIGSTSDMCLDVEPASGAKRKLTGEGQENNAPKRVRENDEKEDPEESIDDLFTPRRRVPMLWSPRLRWKDERRKVLKISVNKLRRIDDPEIFLRRSVLINNTMKRLQRDIREEKQSKYQSQGNYGGVYGAIPTLSATTTDVTCEEGSARSWGFDTQPEDGFPKKMTPRPATPSPPPTTATDDLGEDIFGINEDYLRIHIPKTTTTADASTTSPSEGRVGSGDSVTCTCNTRGVAENKDPPCNDGGTSCVRTGVQQASKNNPNPTLRTFDHHHGLSHCAAQFRTGQDLYMHDGPILDSVVYHSLLASLES